MNKYYKLGRVMVGVGLLTAIVGYSLMLIYDDYRPRDYVKWDTKTLKILSHETMSKKSFEVMAFESGVAVEENIIFHTMEVEEPWWLSLAKFIGQMQMLSCSKEPTAPGPTQPSPDPGAPSTQKDDWWFDIVGGKQSFPIETANQIAICGIDTGFTQHPDIKIEGSISMVGGSVTDVVGHGTATLSVMAGLNNNVGIRGISQAKLYMCKALGDDGSGSMDGIAQCVQWCANSTTAKVINMSLGGPQASQLLYQSIAQARSKGIFVVAAAGNDSGMTNFPARYDNVISVSATTRSDVIARFSSRGKVEYSAPGENVLVAVPTGAKMCNGSTGYCVVSGTSFSSPLTAGVCAIALAKGKSCDNLGVDFINQDMGTYGKGRVSSIKTVQ